MFLLYIHFCIYHHVYTNCAWQTLIRHLCTRFAPKSLFGAWQRGELLTDSSSTQNHLLLTNHINCLSCLNRYNGHINLCIWGFWILFLFLFCFGAFWSSYHHLLHFFFTFMKLKAYFTQNYHSHVFTLMLFQTCMTYYHSKDTKEEVLKKVHAAHFHTMKVKLEITKQQHKMS